MTWEDRRGLTWCKMHDRWWTSHSHLGLDSSTLNVGARCMSIANRNGRQSDGSGRVVDAAGRTLSIAAIARESHASIEEATRALSELCAVETMKKLDDGAYSFPNMKKWQESPAAERVRKHRERYSNAQKDRGSEDQKKEEEEREESDTETVTETPPAPFSLEIPGMPIESVHPPDTILVLPCKAARSGPNRSAKAFPVTERYVRDLETIFEYADIRQVLREIERWVKRKPEKMKTFDGWEQCIETWIKSENDKARERTGGRAPATKKPPREWNG